MIHGRAGIVQPTCFDEQLFMQPKGHSQHKGVKVRKEAVTPLAGSDKTGALAQQRQRCERQSHQGPLTEVTQRNGCTEACICYCTEQRDTKALQAERAHPNRGPSSLVSVAVV